MSARIRLSQTQNTGLRQARRGRRGISLLEVMLAIAILGGSMAVIVQMVHTGSRAAIRARELTQAQIHAESVMSQIVSGVVLPQTASTVPVETYDMAGEWMYSVDVQPGQQEGMLMVAVTVERTLTSLPKPVMFTLQRLLVDPEFEAMMTSDEEMSELDDGSADSTESQSGESL
ncbi:MAG TPA: hypothetical protein DCY79_11780 [Planctomycetaceae bacterium]|nr:hypothetical protein [Planctomycetaceae bacterium]